MGVFRQAQQLDTPVKTAVLIESLPWLKRFHGQVIVVKFGGNAMVDEELTRAFAEDMAYLHFAGIRPVVVHGGGPQISARLAELGIASEFAGGYRVTTAETIPVVKEVLTGVVSAQLASQIDEHGDLATILSGESDGLFTAERRGALVDGQLVDIGFVGDVVAVNAQPVLEALEKDRIPVISSIAPDAAGQLHNVNADSAASALAIALQAAKLVVLTDVAGLYGDWPNRESLISVIDAAELRALLPTLESGMIPKMAACLEAVEGGVAKAAIIDGRVSHSILLEIFTTEGIGTEVIPA
jgi:acetylglutamate kinase